MNTSEQKPAWKAFVPAMVLCLAFSFGLYGRTLRHGFVKADDPRYVIDNPLTERLDLAHLRQMFTRLHFTDYLPVLQVFLAVERFFLGSPRAEASAFDSSGYHAVSVLLHALNGALLFLLLRRVLRERRARWPLAAAVAVFLAHPVQAENVAWIAEQKTLLSTALLLGSVLCYARFRDGGARAAGWYAGAMIAGACAMFAKSGAVVLPALLVLFDCCMAKRRFGRAVLAVMPAAALALIAVVTTLISQAHSGAISARQGAPPMAMFVTMLPVFAQYFRMILLPHGLAYFYYVPRPPAAPAVLVGGAVVVLAALGLYLCARRSRRAFFCAAWYVVSLLPVLNIVPLNTLMADRYLYLPLAGAAGLLALGLSSVHRTQCARIRASLGMAAALAIVCLAILTGRQTTYWKSDVAMWTRSLTHAPQRFKPWYHAGLSFMERAVKVRPQQPEQATRLLKRAVRTFHQTLDRFGRRDPRVLTALGGAYWEAGDRDSGTQFTRRALDEDPLNAVAHANLGQMLAQQQQWAEAQVHLELALTLAGESKELQGREVQLRSLLQEARQKLRSQAPGVAAEQDQGTR